MRITESKLRSIIRSVIRENEMKEIAEGESPDEFLDREGITSVEDIFMPERVHENTKKAKQNIHELGPDHFVHHRRIRGVMAQKLAEFDRKYNELPEEEKAEVDRLAKEIEIKKDVIAVENVKVISKIIFGTAWAAPLIIFCLGIIGVITIPAAIAAAPWAAKAVAGSVLGGLFQFGVGDLPDHSDAVNDARAQVRSQEIDHKYRRARRR